MLKRLFVVIGLVSALMLYPVAGWSAPAKTSRSNIEAPNIVHRVATLADLRGMVGHSGQRAVQVMGYYVAGDGGGGPPRMWKSGAAPGSYIDNGGSVIVPVGGDGSGAWVWEWSGPGNVRWFGAKGDGIADETTAIQASLNSGNKVVDIPDGTYVFSQLTLANDGQVLRLSSGANIRPTIWNQNALVVAGDAITITGGKITSASQWDGANTAWTYAVVYVTGDRFTADNVTLINVPRIGFGIREASDARIVNCRIEGNYPAGSWTGVETGHFGVTYDPGPTSRNLTVQGCTILSCVQGIFVGDFGAASTTGGILISGNTFEACHNHGVYAYGGFGNIISTNTFYNCSYPIAALGAGTIITGNMLYTNATGSNTDLTGISVREPVGCIITGNKISGDAPAGGVIIDLVNIVSTVTKNNIISGNVVDVVGGASIGIRVGTAAMTEVNSNNIISGNIIRTNGSTFSGVLFVGNKPGFSGRNNEISSNNLTIIGDSYGIVLEEQVAATVTRNKITVEYNAPSAKVPGLFKTVGVVDSEFSWNQCYSTSDYGTNLSYRVFWGGVGDARNRIDNNKILLSPTLATSIAPLVNTATASLRGNLFKATDPLAGSFTLTTASASVVVPNGNIVGQNVTIKPTNAAAAVMVATQGFYLTVSDGVSFSLTTGNGAAPANNATFSYSVD